MKILIAGSNLNAKLLARYLKLENDGHDIYVTTDEKDESNSYTAINIRENDVVSITDFVKYNQIEFTIATSAMAIINGLADEFKKEGFPIFSPFSEAARVTYFNSIAKKIMYKLKINTPKFGIFDRENLAIDYVRRAKYPIVVENDFTLLSREHYIFPTFSKARVGIQKIFEEANTKVVIENYIDEEPIYMYFVTDGYNALPLINLTRTSGDKYATITAPSKKISDEIIVDVMQKAIYPLLDDITKYADMYTGIIGLKMKYTKNSFYVMEFYNGFQENDFQAFLSLLDDNLLNILVDTANGSLADSHDIISLSDKFSYTVAVDKSLIKKESIEEDDFIESEDASNFIYTSTASTLNNAKENLFDYLSLIADEEFAETLITAEKEKELKV